MIILGPSATGPIPPGHALVLDPTHPCEWLWPLSRCQVWKRDRDTETARWLMALRRPPPSWCRASVWPIQNIPGCCFRCFCPHTESSLPPGSSLDPCLTLGRPPRPPVMAACPSAGPRVGVPEPSPRLCPAWSFCPACWDVGVGFRPSVAALLPWCLGPALQWG